ncbi:MAG: hypothetical protein UX46_C0012G0005 [Candidatus Amesbacteria bacterium GW2011_GWC1_46_24]|nr:MAG: hypothetical protein UX46_C0012G0005 [Candidatus Amesbacteria bacterium GW2011_GWC1_46_24]
MKINKLVNYLKIENCKLKILYVLAAFSSFYFASSVMPSSIHALTRYSVATGNWNATSTWSATSGGSSGASAPVAGDTVIIDAGFTVTVTVDAACATINYSTGVNGTVSGLTINSGITLAVSSTFTMERPANNNDSNLTINSGIVTIGGNLALGGTTSEGDRTAVVNISTGTLTVSGNITFAGVNSKIIFSSSGTLNLAGSFGTGGTFTMSTSTVNFNGSSAQTTATGYTFYNIKSNNTAGVTLGEAETINNLTIGDVTGGSIFADGGLQLTSTATLTLTSGTFKLGNSAATIFPAFTGGISIAAGTTVEYASATAQTVSITPSYQHLTFSGAGTKTTSAGTLSVAGNWTAGSTTALNTSNTTVNVTGNFNGTGSVTQGSNLITIAGDYANTGTLTASATGFTMSGIAKQISGAGAITFTTLNISNSVTNNRTSTVTVSTALSGAGTLTNGTDASLSIGGTSGITGLTATNSGNTVNYNANGNQTACFVTTYYNLTLSGTGANTKTFATPPTVNNTLSMQGTATVTVTSGVVTYGASAKLQYSTTTGRTASSEEWITPFAATGGVQISSTGTITMNEAKVFSAGIPLLVDSGAALNTGNFQLSLGGNFTATGATFTAGSSKIVIGNGTATQSITGYSTTGETEMTKTGGTATFQSAVNGVALTINGSGGTLNLGSSLTHTFTGDITLTAGTLNAGTTTILNANSSTATAWTGTGSNFTCSTGTVTFAGTNQTINTATTFNNLNLNNSGTKTLGANTVVNTAFTLATGVTIDPGAFVLSGAGTFAVTGTPLTPALPTRISSSAVPALPEPVPT